MKHFLYCTIAMAAVLAFSTLGANASPLDGSTVIVTSSVNGGTTQTQTVTVGTPDTEGASAEITSGFAWMHAGDFLDFYFDGTYNVLRVSFTATDSFIVADDILLTVQLSPDWSYGPAALTSAIDVQVPSASITGNTLTSDLSGLDQINGNGGYIEYTFDAVQTPEPATLGLFALGGVAFWLARRRQIAS